MKTTEEIISKDNPNYKYDQYSFEEVENFMLIYAKEVLILATEKANIILKGCYSEDFIIKDEETVRYNTLGVSSVYAEECSKFKVRVNKDSILNIINELK